MGVPVTISTDDPTISDVSLTEEYPRTMRHTGLSISEAWRINRHALTAAFADEPAARRLVGEFDDFAPLIPELMHAS